MSSPAAIESASGPVQPAAPNPPSLSGPALQAVDLNFFAADVAGAGWAAWGAAFKSLADLAGELQAALGPDRRVRRLVIAANGAGHAGMICFDPMLARREIVDAVMRDPIRPDLRVQLRRLRRFLRRDSIVEFRVAGIGEGDHGVKILSALADVLGVATRGPSEPAAAVADAGGLITDWLTVFPTESGLTPVWTSWREQPGPEAQVEVAYAPVAGATAPALAEIAGNPTAPVIEMSVVAPSAAGWRPGGPELQGIAGVVDHVISLLGPGQRLRRLSIGARGSERIDGFAGFDHHSPALESIDGALRGEAEYAHLEIVDPHVSEQLRRLRPHLAEGAVLEVLACRFGAGDNGRRALQALADAVGVTARGPAGSAHELGSAGGLITSWTTCHPSSSGLAPSRSAWIELSTPEAPPGWIPLEKAAYAPFKHLPAPPLPVVRPMAEPAAAAAETPTVDLLQAVVPAPPAVPYRGEDAEEEPGGELRVVQVRCGSCDRVLDEPPAVPIRARPPCPRCKSLARRTELVTRRRRRESPWARVVAAIRRPDPNRPIVA